MNKAFIPITGTFIDGVAADIPANNWTKRVWAKELAEQNKKSMAYELVFRHSERTLRDDEVNNAMDKLRKALENDLKVELR